MYKIHCELYKIDIHVFIGAEPVDNRKVNKKKDGGATWMKKGIVHMWLSNKRHTGEVMHECIHAANFILHSRGVKISTKNDEALTYLVEWIYGRLK